MNLIKLDLLAACAAALPTRAFQPSPAGRGRTCSVLAALIMWVGTAAAQPTGRHGNLPLPPQEMEQRMRQQPFEITEVDGAGGGVMGAKKLELKFRDGVTFKAKWKASAAGGEGWNNAPRREIAAYRLQQLYLDPDDYLIPPVVARCIPFETYHPIEADPAATLEDTRCVLGTLSAWLQNVTMPSSAFDAERFASDRRYAYHFANLNLLTYLINHRDARQNNFLMSEEQTNPQVFSIDNGIAFGGVIFNVFASHLDQIRVGGMPKQSITRVRRLTRDDWQRLAVVEQLQVDSDGVLQPVPFTPPSDPQEGNRWSAGSLQLGLTAEEIDYVMQRVAALLLEVDQGTVAPF